MEGGLGGGGGAAAGSCWERKEGHADKVVDIERMTKNPTPGFLFSNFSVGGGGSRRAGQQLFSYVTR